MLFSQDFCHPYYLYVNQYFLVRFIAILNRLNRDFPQVKHMHMFIFFPQVKHMHMFRRALQQYTAGGYPLATAVEHVHIFHMMRLMVMQMYTI